jgi:hypothetical protein
MDDRQYLNHCRELLASFTRELLSRTDSLPEDHPLRALAGDFRALCQDEGADLYLEAPPMVSRLFTGFPEFTPTFPRELLWFLGGECLHYMPDEEIALHQQLEQQRLEAAARGETLNLRDARANLLKLQ